MRAFVGESHVAAFAPQQILRVVLAVRPAAQTATASHVLLELRKKPVALENGEISSKAEAGAEISDGRKKTDHEVIAPVPASHVAR